MNPSKMIYQLTDVQKIVSAYAGEEVSARTILAHVHKGMLKSCGTTNQLGRQVRIYDDDCIQQYLIAHRTAIGSYPLKKGTVLPWKNEKEPT